MRCTSLGSQRNSKSYKEYYAITSGAEPPKTKASIRKKQSSFDTTVPPLTKGKRLKISAKVDKPAKEKQPTNKEVDDQSDDDQEDQDDDDQDDHDDDDDDQDESTTDSFVSSCFISNMLNPSPDTAVRLQSDRLQDEVQEENEDFLNKLDENIQKIIKEQVKEQFKVQVSKI
nr:hypothetical protein [Tanacetum cinerariifolium]